MILYWSVGYIPHACLDFLFHVIYLGIGSEWFRVLQIKAQSEVQQSCRAFSGLWTCKCPETVWPSSKPNPQKNRPTFWICYIFSECFCECFDLVFGCSLIQVCLKFWQYGPHLTVDHHFPAPSLGLPTWRYVRSRTSRSDRSCLIFLACLLPYSKRVGSAVQICSDLQESSAIHVYSHLSEDHIGHLNWRTADICRSNPAWEVILRLPPFSSRSERKTRTSREDAGEE